jgi:hypothetical protein
MSDNSGKGAPRTFEPPPWERDAFEELARKREAEEATARETAEAMARLDAGEASKAGMATPVVVPAAVVTRGAESPLREDAAPEARPKVEEAKVVEMMAGLSLEEPRIAAPRHVGTGAGVLLAVLGPGMIVASVWLLATGDHKGATVGLLVMMSIAMGGFGLGFTVLGGVMLYRSRLQARS